MVKFCDLEGLCCPLCGTSLMQPLKSGLYYDLLMDNKVLTHMVCAEHVGGMRLLNRIRHVSTGTAEVRWRYKY